MPTMTRQFSVGDIVWVVNPTIPALFTGTVTEINMTRYQTEDWAIDEYIKYTIYIESKSINYVSLEEYVTGTQGEGLTLLASLIDSNTC